MIMLINEARFTPLTTDIKNQIRRLVNDFYKNYIEKRGKISNLTLDQSKQNVKKMIHNSKNQEIFIGRIYLGKELNKEIPIFIKDTGSGGTYYEETEEFHEHIVIAFSTIFKNLNHALYTLAHEVVHAIQKYKKGSESYYEITDKMVRGMPITKEEYFVYYTEPSEFEANASELGFIINRFYEKKNTDKNILLFVLNKVLRFPKKRMDNFFNSFYIRYVMNAPKTSEKQKELMMNYLKEIFEKKIYFLKNIAESPDNKPSNINKSNRYWRQFKQKLFNLIQNLEKRKAKVKPQN